MLFASTHSPFTRTHSNHKLQPNSRNTASKHITAASAAQRHLTKSNICLYQLASALAVCPGGGMPAYGVSCPPPHRSHPAARQRRCHGGTMKRSAELDSVQNYYFERFDGLDFGERICRPSLSPNRLCSSFALAVVSGLWFVCVQALRASRLCHAFRAAWCQKQASEMKMQHVVSSKYVINQTKRCKFYKHFSTCYLSAKTHFIH